MSYRSPIVSKEKQARDIFEKYEALIFHVATLSPEFPNVWQLEKWRDTHLTINAQQIYLRHPPMPSYDSIIGELERRCRSNKNISILLTRLIAFEKFYSVLDGVKLNYMHAFEEMPTKDEMVVTGTGANNRITIKHIRNWYYPQHRNPITGNIVTPGEEGSMQCSMWVSLTIDWADSQVLPKICDFSSEASSVQLPEKRYYDEILGQRAVRLAEGEIEALHSTFLTMVKASSSTVSPEKTVVQDWLRNSAYELNGIKVNKEEFLRSINGRLPGKSLAELNSSAVAPQYYENGMQFILNFIRNSGFSGTRAVRLANYFTVNNFGCLDSFIPFLLMSMLCAYPNYNCCVTEGSSRVKIKGNDQQIRISVECQLEIKLLREIASNVETFVICRIPLRIKIGVQWHQSDEVVPLITGLRITPAIVEDMLLPHTTHYLSALMKASLPTEARVKEFLSKTAP